MHIFYLNNSIAHQLYPFIGYIIGLYTPLIPCVISYTGRLGPHFSYA